MKFALIGAAGYVAPRHMKAIRETENELIAAADISDSVGILDSYFPHCKFFPTTHHFWEYLEDKKVDYVTVCTPNCYHYIHSLNSMMIGADVICEKPIVTSTKLLEELQKGEENSGRRVNVVLQLRNSPEIIRIKESLDPNKRCKVDMTYVTPRGPWYQASWKGDQTRSGGLLYNIGIHLFDILLWLFGPCESHTISDRTNEKAQGTLTLKNADVDWFLSVNRHDLPNGPGAYRSMTIDGEVHRFDKVFADLHTEVYRKVLEGEGFSLNDCYPSISLVEKLNRERFS
jgi:UDP-N-acetyl-2-amino-2-deoxyglucuronate dehydrogenase